MRQGRAFVHAAPAERTLFATELMRLYFGEHAARGSELNILKVNAALEWSVRPLGSTLNPPASSRCAPAVSILVPSPARQLTMRARREYSSTLSRPPAPDSACSC